MVTAHVDEYDPKVKFRFAVGVYDVKSSRLSLGDPSAACGLFRTKWRLSVDDVMLGNRRGKAMMLF